MSGRTYVKKGPDYSRVTNWGRSIDPNGGLFLIGIFLERINPRKL